MIALAGGAGSSPVVVVLFIKEYIMKRRQFLALVGTLPFISWFVPKVEAKEKRLEITYTYNCNWWWMENVWQPETARVFGEDCARRWSLVDICELFRPIESFQKFANRLFQEIPDDFTLTNIDLHEKRYHWCLKLTGISGPAKTDVPQLIDGEPKLLSERGASLVEVSFKEI